VEISGIDMYKLYRYVHMYPMIVLVARRLSLIGQRVKGTVEEANRDCESDYPRLCTSSALVNEPIKRTRPSGCQESIGSDRSSLCRWYTCRAAYIQL